MTKAQERIAERRMAEWLRPISPTKRYAKFSKGHVHQGTRSKHKTNGGRRFNLRIRIIQRFHTPFWNNVL